jgi:hypothetical protein
MSSGFWDQFLDVLVKTMIVVAAMALLATGSFLIWRGCHSFADRDTTRERCAEDCGDREALYKNGMFAEHPECWCKTDDFYEVMW